MFNQNLKKKLIYTLIIVLCGSNIAGAAPNYTYTRVNNNKIYKKSQTQNAKSTKNINNLRTTQNDETEETEPLEQSLEYYQTQLEANKDSNTTVLHGSVTEIHQLYPDWQGGDAYSCIKRIGDKLVESNNINKNIVFQVVTTDESNASTDLKNRISIYTGLLKYVETEDELAAVIAHELGHAANNHVIHSTLRSGAASGTILTGGVLSTIGRYSESASNLGWIGAVTSLGGMAIKGINKQFDKGAEYDADEASCDYLANAGYNPLALISILNKISGNYFDWFSSHPSTDKRLTKIYKYVDKKYPSYIENGYDSESYKRALTSIKKEK